MNDEEARAASQVALRSTDFTQPAPRLIYDAATAIRSDGGVPNLVTITAHIQSLDKLDDIGGEAALAELAAIDGIDPKEIKSYCKSLKDFSYKRRLIYLSKKLGEFSKSTETTKELSQKVRDAMRLAEDRSIPDDAHLNPGEIVQQVGINKFWNPLLGETFIDTDWDRVNDLIIGFMRGTLNILAARPSVGKSALAAQILLRAAKKGIPVLFCSLEMKRDAIIRRLCCGLAEVNLRKVLKNECTPVEKARLMAALSSIQDIPLEVTNIYGRTTSEIEQAIRSVRQKYGSIGMVAIDHLQLTRPLRKHANRHGEIAEVTGTIKQQMLEFDIPCLLLSQLNRLMTKRDGDDAAPNLGDLRESGAIEEDADSVLMLHRPEMFKKDGDKTKAKVYVRKNRDGEIGEVDLKFVPQYTRFDNSDEDYDIAA